MNEWIPIDPFNENAQAPEDRQDVLVYNKQETMQVGEYQRIKRKVGHEYQYHQFLEVVEGYSSIPVTHWMPLPEPPTKR